LTQTLSTGFSDGTIFSVNQMSFVWQNIYIHNNVRDRQDLKAVKLQTQEEEYSHVSILVMDAILQPLKATKTKHQNQQPNPPTHSLTPPPPFS